MRMGRHRLRRLGAVTPGPLSRRSRPAAHREGTQGRPGGGLRRVWDGLRWPVSWSGFGPISSSRLRGTSGQGQLIHMWVRSVPGCVQVPRPVLSPARRGSRRCLLDTLLPPRVLDTPLALPTYLQLLIPEVQPSISLLPGSLLLPGKYFTASISRLSSNRSGQKSMTHPWLFPLLCLLCGINRQIPPPPFFFLKMCAASATPLTHSVSLHFSITSSFCSPPEFLSPVIGAL